MALQHLFFYINFRKENIMRKIKTIRNFISLILFCVCIASGYFYFSGETSIFTVSENTVSDTFAEIVDSVIDDTVETDITVDVPFEDNIEPAATETVITEDVSEQTSVIPAYYGVDIIELNGNIPNLNKSDGAVNFVNYSELDYLGRAGTAYACLGYDTLATTERPDISEIHPSGWHSGYDPAAWNRSHLIAFCLASNYDFDLNNSIKNMITGTDYFNQTLMWSYEERVQDYIIETGNNVLYRVTPVYSYDGVDTGNLVPYGVIMEALSVEDNTLEFNVFIYNVKPGVDIDYKTGESSFK